MYIQYIQYNCMYIGTYVLPYYLPSYQGFINAGSTEFAARIMPSESGKAI